MLTDEQLDFFGEALTDVFQQLENDIISDIARRVRKTQRWTETAELQAEAMRELGWSPYKIRLEVFKKLNADPEYRKTIDENTLAHKAKQQEAIDAAIAKLKDRCPEIFEEVGNMSFRNDLSLWAEAGETLVRGSAVDKLVREMTKRAEGDLINLTKSLGFRMPDGSLVAKQKAYTQAMNRALTQTVTGTMSAREACTRAVRELARSGLRKVDYASGKSWQLDTAAMNSIRTSAAQLAGDIMQTNIEESGVEYVQVSEHWGARPSHAEWQGGIYHVEQFKAICGYGDPGDPDHIYSYNCRHHHYPFWPGISEKLEYPPEPGPFEIDGKKYTYYEATQKQRKMEREIRALKREALAEQSYGNANAVAIAGQKIENLKSDYIVFSKQTGIRPKEERLTVVGFDQSTSKWVQNKGKARIAMIADFQEKMKTAGFETKGFRKYYGDQETLDHMSAALTRMSTLFPEEANGALIKWGYSRDKTEFGWFDPKDGSISFNKNVMGNWQSASEQYAAGVKKNESPAGTDLDAVFYHEFGHRVWQCRGNKSLSRPIHRVLNELGYGYVGIAQRDMYLEKELCSYATIEVYPRYGEALAEAFAEWYNSPKPRRFCEALLKEVGILP